MGDLSFPGGGRHPIELIDSAQTLTADWADLGDLQAVLGARRIVLWLDVDQNDSLGLVVRYQITKRASDAAYIDHVHYPGEEEIGCDGIGVPYRIAVGWELNGLIPYIQFQVKVFTVGAIAGTIDAAEATSGIRG